MNRLTDNDRNYGPITIAPWKDCFSAYVSSADEEDRENYILLIAFGWAMRIQIPALIKGFGKYHEEPKQYGFSITKGESGFSSHGWDYATIYYGPQTHDSRTEKRWSMFFPWNQWPCVRNSIYTPDGEHFATESRDRRGIDSFREWMDLQEQCPTSQFDFIDYDGKRIVATCRIDEREWHRGEGRFKWLRWFYPVQIRRVLNLSFSEEVGPEKGSWKGGTIGTSTEMREGDTPEKAFRRFCEREHDARRGKKYRIKFIGAIQPVAAQ